MSADDGGVSPRGIEGGRPTEADRGRKRGSTETSTTTATSDDQKTAPRWRGGAIILPKNVFPVLQKALKKDKDHIRFQSYKKQKEVASTTVNGKTRTASVPAGAYGVLEVDEAYMPPEPSFLWTIVGSIHRSNNSALIAFPIKNADTVLTAFATRDKRTKAIKIQTIEDVLRQGGLTLASQNLTRKIYRGELLPAEKELVVMSPYEDLSVIYLFPRMATETTVVHEFFGHLFIAFLGLPYGHDDSLKGQNVKGADGKVFDGTVLEFITKQVVPQLE